MADFPILRRRTQAGANFLLLSFTFALFPCPLLNRQFPEAKTRALTVVLVVVLS